MPVARNSADPAPSPSTNITSFQLWLLAAVGALGSFAIHTFVPAMPAAAAYFRVPPATIQLTISAYLLGLSTGQLLAGPVVDRWGRKPVLLAGSQLFVLASIAAALAPSATILIAARFVQACGGAAGLVATRSLVSDLSTRDKVVANMAALTSVTLLSPTFAPTLGGAIVGLAGWHAVFVIHALLGLIAGAAVWILVRPPARIHEPAPLVGSYIRLLRNRRFLGYAAVSALGSSALYIFLSASPFILIGGLGLTPAQAGLCYLAVAASGIAGTIIVRRLDPARDLLRIGLMLILIGGICMVLTSRLGVAGLILPMQLISVGAGFTAPLGIAGAMHAEEGLVGTASSLAGATQMAASGVATSIASTLIGASPLALAIGIVICGAAAFIVAPRQLR